uniref:DNA-directed RNA polymerase subunit Rpo6 n=1 Tax=Staphylothermus marinus TaxID=2280 RepID=A0A7C4JM21_STAMA
MSKEVFREVWSKSLTRFELARVIGARAAQLAHGAPPLIDPSEAPSLDPVAIAIVELLKGVIPITIKRVYADGSYEYIPVSRTLSDRNRKYLESILESWNIGKISWSDRLGKQQTSL